MRPMLNKPYRKVQIRFSRLEDALNSILERVEDKTTREIIKQEIEAQRALVLPRASGYDK